VKFRTRFSKIDGGARNCAILNFRSFLQERVGFHPAFVAAFTVFAKSLFLARELENGKKKLALHPPSGHRRWEYEIQNGRELSGVQRGAEALY